MKLLAPLLEKPRKVKGALFINASSTAGASSPKGSTQPTPWRSESWTISDGERGDDDQNGREPCTRIDEILGALGKNPRNVQGGFLRRGLIRTAQVTDSRLNRIARVSEKTACTFLASYVPEIAQTLIL
jgi:hypothetical protein